MSNGSTPRLVSGGNARPGRVGVRKDAGYLDMVALLIPGVILAVAAIASEARERTRRVQSGR